MLLRPPRPTRTDPLFPYTTRVRSRGALAGRRRAAGGGEGHAGRPARQAAAWQRSQPLVRLAPCLHPAPDRRRLPLSGRQLAAAWSRHAAARFPMKHLRTGRTKMIARRITGLFAASFVVLGFLAPARSEEHTSELQSLMRISYAVFCLKKQTQ